MAGFFDTTKTGDLTSRLSADTTKVGDQVSLNVNFFLRSDMHCSLRLPGLMEYERLSECSPSGSSSSSMPFPVM